MAAGPLLVFGPRSTTYDFGPSHPLTPRRFGPGIDLLRALGAEPGLAPEPASDEDLRMAHTARYIEIVRRFSADPSGPRAAGIGPGDDPSFAGMHAAAASVAGGSIRAIEALLRGDVEHAFHPGGGLHHAMPDRASGFCIYDDPALAIARARRAGLRVLYVDLDVHHGDGVQAIHADDPGVLTLSFHESGRYLFPGTGAASELGAGRAAGTVVNVPLEPMAGETAWLSAVESLLPALAASFGPDLIVSQHGADTHAWDPLAHLRVTTTAMGRAARLVDRVAHRWAGGRWLATGGGGYDAYRVVPRAWALTWLAGAHRDDPGETPATWRERWRVEAERFGQAPMPVRFADPPNAGLPLDEGGRSADRRSTETASLVRSIVVPALLREAVDRGWWAPDARSAGSADAGSAEAGMPGGSAGAAGSADAGMAGGSAGAAGPADAGMAEAPSGTPTLVGPLDRGTLEGLRLARRVIAPTDSTVAAEILAAAADAGATVAGAVVGDVLVAVAVIAPGADPDRLLAVGVAPGHRGIGLGTEVLRRAIEQRAGGDPGAGGGASGTRGRDGMGDGRDRAGGRGNIRSGRPIEAIVTVAERDPIEPADADVRRAVAERLLSRVGFSIARPPETLGGIDPWAVAGRHESR